MTPEKEKLALSWHRNVKDEFKPLTQEEIFVELEKTRNPFAAAFEHWTGDFNMATGFRNANAFNALETFYIGPKQWDRRGAVGVHHYMKITNCKTFTEFFDLIKDKYTLVGIDNIPGESMDIESFPWSTVCDKKPLLLFGEEGCGLTKEALDNCEYLLHIKMYGSVRSFNCGTASGIAMYDFVKKFNNTIPGENRWE